MMYQSNSSYLHSLVIDEAIEAERSKLKARDRE